MATSSSGFDSTDICSVEHDPWLVLGCGRPTGHGLCIYAGDTPSSRLVDRHEGDGIDEVYRCRCNSPGCPDCGWLVARRNASKLQADCERLGITELSTLCITSDPKRFPDPWHVKKSSVAYKVMWALWGLMSKRYRAEWGERPLYWCAWEVQEGKRSERDRGTGNIHVHVYFPSPNKTGRISRAALDTLRETGNALSGRTTYGWVNSGAYSLPVRDVSGYATKVMEYATKGISEMPELIADCKSFRPFTRSDAVTADDPACVARRVRSQERRSECDALKRSIVAARERRDYVTERSLKAVLKAEWESPGRRREMRTNSERVADCGSSCTLYRDGSYSPLPVAYDDLRSVIGHALVSSGRILCSSGVLNDALATISGNAERAGTLWHDSSPCPDLVEQRASATTESKQSVHKMPTRGLEFNYGNRQPVRLVGKSGQSILCLTEWSGRYPYCSSGQGASFRCNRSWKREPEYRVVSSRPQERPAEPAKRAIFIYRESFISEGVCGNTGPP